MPRSIPVMMTVLLATYALAPTASAADKLIERNINSELITIAPDGALQYLPNKFGGTILDFSHCGYQGGGVAIPDVPVVTTLSPTESGGDSDRIQQAIDELASQPIGADGFRGAILLEAGTYRIDKPLAISHSGIVLRGAGPEVDTGTILYATMQWTPPEESYEGMVARGVPAKEAKRAHRNSLVVLSIAGQGDRELHEEQARAITDQRIVVGSHQVNVEEGHAFTVGDEVIVERMGNMDWIRTIRMDQIIGADQEGSRAKNWGEYRHQMERVITAVDGTTLTLDVPLPIDIDQRWGGGRVIPYTFAGRISQVGAENFRIEVETDSGYLERLKDPYHPERNVEKKKTNVADLARGGTGLSKVENGWIRNVYSVRGMWASPGTKFSTFQDCVLKNGQYGIGASMMLFNRCYVETGRHTFSFGSRVAGPNAIVDCISSDEHSDAEPHHRYSLGGLFDNVHAFMKCQDRQSMGSGHGIQGTNYVFWNTKGRVTINRSETDENYCIGHVGARGLGTFVYRAKAWRSEHPDDSWPTWARIPQGHWEHHGQHVKPRSLYLAQLEDRLGADAVRAIASKEQLEGFPHSAIIDRAEALGAEFTDMARERVQDLSSWVRLHDRHGTFEDAEIKGVDQLIKTDIPNHFE